MATQSWLPAQDPQFDGFLFAQVGEDRNGVQVSVLSALARLGVDPWQEARQLAGLPVDHARQRLDTLIAALPGIPALLLNHRSIANRLIALLPGKGAAPAEAPKVAAAVAAKAVVEEDAKRKRNFVIAGVVLFLLFSQTLMLFNRNQAPVSGTSTPISAPHLWAALWAGQSGQVGPGRSDGQALVVVSDGACGGDPDALA